MPQATLTTYLPGDILFYAKLENNAIGKIISDWTGSQFVHVAVAISAIQKVEALFSGIVRTPIDEHAIAAAYRYTAHASPLVPVNLARALEWIQGQVGSVYGWGDIANAFLAKFVHGVSVDIGEHMDCSALACEFLLKAGSVDLGTLINPHEVTPAALARQLNVKPGDR